MAQNTSPTFPLSGDLSTNGTTGYSQLITAAANDYTGISANNTLVHTAGTNGSFVSRLRIKAGGSNVASVLRIYVNNGSTNTTAANNAFIGEISLPATTASATAATAEIEYPLGFAMPASHRIYVGLGTAVAAGWCVVCIGGQY